MVEKYNSLDIYIFKLYEKKYDNEYYDESIDLYVTDTYFKLKGFCLGIIKDQDKIFDIINRKEISLLNVNAKNNEEFALMDEYVKFNSSVSIRISLKISFIFSPSNFSSKIILNVSK